MSAPVLRLNVLRHPRRRSAWAWPHLPWFWVGLLCGGLCVAGLHLRHEATAQQRQQQAHAQALAAQQQARQLAARQQVQRGAQQQAHAQAVQAQQQRMVALQDVLQVEAERGLRLSRWQADGQRWALQGQLPSAQDVATLQTRLGQALGQGWSVQSLGAGPASVGVLWSLETPSPSAHATGAKP
ncbi:MAG: hypothetical protein RL559_1364 [Pseudomonadota bacterium]|jgi:hypothetical protein